MSCRVSFLSLAFFSLHADNYIHHLHSARLHARHCAYLYFLSPCRYSHFHKIANMLSLASVFSVDLRFLSVFALLIVGTKSSTDIYLLQQTYPSLGIRLTAPARTAKSPATAATSCRLCTESYNGALQITPHLFFLTCFMRQCCVTTKLIGVRTGAGIAQWLELRTRD